MGAIDHELIDKLNRAVTLDVGTLGTVLTLLEQRKKVARELQHVGVNRDVREQLEFFNNGIKQLLGL